MGRNDKFIRDSNKKPWLKLQKMINKKILTDLLCQH
jgi:hypothetical protein